MNCFNFLHTSCMPAVQVPIVTGTGPPDPCGTPPDPSTFAYRVAYAVGVSVTYRCIHGYVQLLGDEQLNCSLGGWQGVLLQCRSKSNNQRCDHSCLKQAAMQAWTDACSLNSCMQGWLNSLTLLGSIGVIALDS